MTTPEQALVRRRRQILEETRPLDTPEHEDTWVRDFIARLAGVIRNIGGKK